MNFSEPPPPFYPPQFAGGSEGAAFWPQFPLNNEAPDQHMQFQHPPPSKRPRSCDDMPANSTPYPPMNSRTTPSIPPPVYRGANNIFFKTRICSKFMIGECRNGETCKFAHGEEDIRRPPKNWQALVTGRAEERFTGNWENDEKIILRMKLCKKFCNGGECPFGDRCNFLHEDPSKFRNDTGRYRENSAISISHRESSAISIGYRESAAISIGTEPSHPHQGRSNPPESNRAMNVSVDSTQSNPALKTKLCLKFERGQCPYGDKCHYAHGIADLQVFGGRAQGEVGNVINVVTRPQPLPTNDLPISATDLSLKQEEQAKKCLLKCKGGAKKMNRIYADWIDDLPLLQSFPNKVES